MHALKEEPFKGEPPKPTSSFLSESPKAEAFVPAALFALCAALISILCWNDPEIRHALVGRPHQIFEMGEWYRLLSSIFVHSDMNTS